MPAEAEHTRFARLVTSRRMDIAGRLRSLELFQGVPTPVLGTLASSSAVRRVHPGRPLPPGDTGSAVLLVLAGLIETVGRAAEGREVVLGLAGPGCALGEAWVPGGSADGAKSCPWEVRALEESVVLTIPADVLQTASERCSLLALSLLAAATRRLRDAEICLAGAVLGDVGSRLAFRLHELAAIRGTRIGGSVRIETPLTQEQLAGMSGTSRETVNRTLAGFTANGWVKREAGRYVLTDVEALRARAMM